MNSKCAVILTSIGGPKQGLGPETGLKIIFLRSWMRCGFKIWIRVLVLDSRLIVFEPGSWRDLLVFYYKE